MSEGVRRIYGSIEPSKVVDIIATMFGICGGGRGKKPSREDAFRRLVLILTQESGKPPIRGTVLLGNMA